MKNPPFNQHFAFGWSFSSWFVLPSTFFILDPRSWSSLVYRHIFRFRLFDNESWWYWLRYRSGALKPLHFVALGRLTALVAPFSINRIDMNWACFHENFLPKRIPSRTKHHYLAFDSIQHDLRSLFRMFPQQMWLDIQLFQCTDVGILKDPHRKVSRSGSGLDRRTSLVVFDWSSSVVGGHLRRAKRGWM